MTSKTEMDFRRKERRIKIVKCAICGEPIPGRLWRVDDKKWACTRCANQR